MWKEFRDFMSRSSVLALAVAVVMGAAFGAVITSFTDDILMQLIAALGAKPDFSQLSVNVRGTPIRYGAFATALLSFLIIAFAMFLVVKGANRLQRKHKEEAPPDSEVAVLKEIRDLLRVRRPV